MTSSRVAGLRVGDARTRAAPRSKKVLTAFPDAHLSIEIKRQEPSIVDAVLAELDTHDARGRVVIASFLDPVMAELRPEALATAITDLQLEENASQPWWRRLRLDTCPAPKTTSHVSSPGVGRTLRQEPDHERARRAARPRARVRRRRRGPPVGARAGPPHP